MTERDSSADEAIEGIVKRCAQGASGGKCVAQCAASMSAIGPKAAILYLSREVTEVPSADIGALGEPAGR